MAPEPRKVTFRGREYRVFGPSIRDPRLHVAAVLLTLQVLGQTVLDFRVSIAQILISIVAGALIDFGYEFFKNKTILWPASGMLTGNSTAFILRVPGTFHGQWWSTHGWHIFLGVVVVSMASKYLIRWRGRHIFNPSNLGLVLAFVILGPQYTEPQDLWWIPVSPWLIVTYAILIGGGLYIGRELKLLGLELGYMAAFAAFTALALLPVPDHCMIASWYPTPMCGGQLWQVLVTSPEVLIFAFFMIPDPRTVPDGPVSRFAFGVIVAFLSVLFLGPTTLEFWTKTAILASLVPATAGRFALARVLAPLDELGGILPGLWSLRWRLPTTAGIAALLMTTLPLSSQLSLHAVVPAPELPDGTTHTLALTVGAPGQDVGAWAFNSGVQALPPPGTTTPTSASGRVWSVPPLPSVSIPDNVAAFGITRADANRQAHSVVLDLLIESEARRTHDMTLAGTAAEADGLREFTDVITQDVNAHVSVQKTYSFTSIQMTLYLPKFSTQGSRLVGVSLHGTTTLITRDAAGKVLSTVTQPYSKSWGLGSQSVDGSYNLIQNDYTAQGLKLA